MKPLLTPIERTLLIVGICLMLFGQGKAHAEGFTAGLHLATRHFGGDGLRTSTPGIELRAASGATGGLFLNSYDHWSGYAGWTWQTPDHAFALTAGAVTGYPAARVMALLVPSLRIPLASHYAVRLAYIPKPLKGGTTDALHLGIEREF